MPESAPPSAAVAAAPVESYGRALVALIGGQIALHSCMAGVRMAAPLAVLREGHAAWAVGMLLGLFAAAPIVLALRAGRLADRHGYHLPIRVAVGLTVAGGLCAVASTFFAAGGFLMLCLAATLCGAGANFGLIAIQRSAGRMAGEATELKRIFSWLGLAPALSNVVGPVLAGVLIDLSGFRLAFAALALLPLASLAWARRVPREVRPVAAVKAPRRNAWNLLQAPGFTRLLLVNWLLSSSWDVHSFLVPILGHERGFSASAIGLVLGVFATAVAAVRLVIPFMAHRLREGTVLVAAMLTAAAVFAVYPFAQAAWVMGLCAVVLGLALGSVQPMIMTTLHQITPAERHGEAIALRSMAINLSSAVMPLAFGLAGAALGASALFWMMGTAVASGSLAARRVGPQAAPP
ncbi:MAG: MFS transporter [Burkholderiales bacterium]|nr:MFS transporter [Burkholderiales bacterium]